MRGLLAGLTVLALLVACGTERRPSARDDDDDMPEVSAGRLDDAFEDPATADFLAPEERTALDRVHAPRSPQTGDHAGEDAAPPRGAVARALDDAGKVGIALLSVGATLGAFIAPFFLF